MRINIISTNNGVGLYHDYLILKDILGQVNFIDWNIRKPAPVADVNIHIEHIRFEYIRSAKKNILIPNPEWFELGWIPKIGVIDQIICKTHEAVEFFSQIHKNVVYSSFTSLDHYQQMDKYRVWLHLYGKSSMKSTQEVYDTFRHNGKQLYMVGEKSFPEASNIKQLKRIPEVDKRNLMNTCMFHLCPSQTEGFGHYINEAKSCGAVIITTDAPPMNELCPGTIKVKSTGRHNYGVLKFIDPVSLIREVERFDRLDDGQLIEISEQNRQSFLDNDLFFKNRIKEIIYGG